MPAAEARAFRDRIARLAETAAAGHGPAKTRRYRIAGKRLDIRFLGDRLVPHITPALAHLECGPDAGPPDLELVCWDCSELGLAYPDAPVAKAEFTPRCEIPALTDASIHTAFEPQAKLLSLFDRDAGKAWYVVGDAREMPRFDKAEPVRAILSWFCRAHGRQFVHAGAVGHEDGGVLLLGRSGMGKSNTALACLQSPLGYAADDFCAISTTGQPTAHSIYSTAKTRQSDWRRFPFFAGLAPDIDPEGREKTIYFLNQATPEKLLLRFPIRALLIVRRSEGPTRLTAALPEAVMTEIAPDTTRLLPDAGGEVFAAVSRLARAAPAYTLHLGGGPADIAPTIDRLLADMRVAAG
jgi:hypothetical protein